MRKIFAALLVVVFVVSGAFAMTPEEELCAWKKEPAYGKTIAITTSIGGSDQNITMRFLLRNGIDPIRGVKYKSTDSGAAVLAMQNGEIAAALLSERTVRCVSSGQSRLMTTSRMRLSACSRSRRISWRTAPSLRANSLRLTRTAANGSWLTVKTL